MIVIETLKVKNVNKNENKKLFFMFFVQTFQNFYPMVDENLPSLNS
mgnify:CR=1 FL=1